MDYTRWYLTTEEDFGIHCTTEYAAGCPIADPDCAADDFPIDQWDEDGI